MRTVGWFAWALAAAGCGPTVAIPSGGTDASTGALDSSDASDASGGGSEADAGDPPPMTGPADTAGTDGDGADASTAGSTGAPPFDDQDVVGSWQCIADPVAFVLHVVDYTSPSALEGTVCAAWNGASDPLQWNPCGTVSAHPIGGGPYLPIYAEISDPKGAHALWVVSAGLVYDPATDTMEGVWFAPPQEPADSSIACTRLP